MDSRRGDWSLKRRKKRMGVKRAGSEIRVERIGRWVFGCE